MVEISRLVRALMRQGQPVSGCRLMKQDVGPILATMLRSPGRRLPIRATPVVQAGNSEGVERSL